IGVERSQYRCDRARRRRGAGACGAVGEEMGVAYVQAGERAAQAVRGEGLGPPASPPRVALDQNELLSLVGTDIEVPTGVPAGRDRRAEQRERVAEGRQRLVSAPRVSGAKQ